MSLLKLLIPAAAALALTACATTTDKTAGGAAVQKTFLGKWEVKAKTPFRDEDGPIQGYGEETGLTAVAGGSKPRS